MQQHPGTGDAHRACASRARRTCSAVTERIMRKSRNATAEAEPRFHHLKPSSYMKYSTLTVLCSGPPWVITYGSANSWKYPATVRMLTSSRVGRNIGSVMRPNSCQRLAPSRRDRKSTRLNSSHSQNSYAVFCLKKKKQKTPLIPYPCRRGRVTSHTDMDICAEDNVLVR